MSNPKTLSWTKFEIGSKHFKSAAKPEIQWSRIMPHSLKRVTSLNKILVLWGCHVGLESVSTTRNLTEVTKLISNHRNELAYFFINNRAHFELQWFFLLDKNNLKLLSQSSVYINLDIHYKYIKHKHKSSRPSHPCFLSKANRGPTSAPGSVSQ